MKTELHLLSLPQTQKSNPEPLQLQQDVVDGRMRVAGQQHAKTTSMEDADLWESDRKERWMEGAAEPVH